MKKPKPLPVRYGRPSLSRAAQIEEHILETATAVFLTEGYGAASIEAIAQRARMSKRTLYHRFEGKADLFAAVVHRMIERLRPPNDAALFEGKSLKEMLLGLGHAVLHAALRKEALGLHRLLVSEATRFPELAMIMDNEGIRQEAIRRIAALLKPETARDPHFAAEQFLSMIISIPQRRALGNGTPMTVKELDPWVKKTVELFLHGLKG